jgi:hypothetical protein
MSKFNYSTELCDQVEQLDDKLSEVITLMKIIEKRVAKLEKIASSKGLLTEDHNKSNIKNQEDACILM